MHTIYAFVAQLTLTGLWLERFDNVTDVNDVEATCYATCYSMRCPAFTLFPNGTCVAFEKILAAIDSRWVYSWIHILSPDDFDNCIVLMPQYVKQSLQQENRITSELQFSVTGQQPGSISHQIAQTPSARTTGDANHSLGTNTVKYTDKEPTAVYMNYSSPFLDYFYRTRTITRAHRTSHSYWETTVNATSAVDAAKFISMIVAISNAVKVKNLNASSTTSFEAPAAASHAKDSPSKAVMSAIKSLLGVTLTSNASHTTISGHVFTAEAVTISSGPTISPSLTSETELDAVTLTDETKIKSSPVIHSEFWRTNFTKVEEAISSTNATRNTSFATKIVPKTTSSESTVTKSLGTQAIASRSIKFAMNVSDDGDEPYAATFPLLDTGQSTRRIRAVEGNLTTSSTISFETSNTGSRAKDSPSEAVISATQSLLGVTLKSDASPTAIFGHDFTEETMATSNGTAISPSLTSETELDVVSLTNKTKMRSLSVNHNDYLRANSKKAEESTSLTARNSPFAAKISPKTTNPKSTRTKSSAENANVPRIIKSAVYMNDDEEPYMETSPVPYTGQSTRRARVVEGNLTTNSTASFETSVAGSNAKDSPSEAVANTVQSLLGVTLATDTSHTAFLGHVITAKAMTTSSGATITPSPTSEMETVILTDKTKMRFPSVNHNNYLKAISKKAEESASLTSGKRDRFTTKIIPKTTNSELTGTKPSAKKASATRRIKSVSDDGDEPYLATSPLLDTGQSTKRIRAVEGNDTVVRNGRLTAKPVAETITSETANTTIKTTGDSEWPATISMFNTMETTRATRNATALEAIKSTVAQAIAKTILTAVTTEAESTETYTESSLQPETGQLIKTTRSIEENIHATKNEQQRILITDRTQADATESMDSAAVNTSAVTNRALSYEKRITKIHLPSVNTLLSVLGTVNASIAAAGYDTLLIGETGITAPEASTRTSARSNKTAVRSETYATESMDSATTDTSTKIKKTLSSEKRIAKTSKVVEKTSAGKTYELTATIDSDILPVSTNVMVNTGVERVKTAVKLLKNDAKKVNATKRMSTSKMEPSISEATTSIMIYRDVKNGMTNITASTPDVLPKTPEETVKVPAADNHMLPTLEAVAETTKDGNPFPTISTIPPAANRFTSIARGLSTETEMTTESVDCDNGWIEYERHCFLWINGPLSYPEAQSKCDAYGAQLATLDQNSTAEFVDREVRNWRQNAYWIGLHNVNNFTWEWPNGKIVFKNETRWRPGQPDGCCNINDEHYVNVNCAVANIDRCRAFWDDTGCNMTKYINQNFSAVCEKSAL